MALNVILYKSPTIIHNHIPRVLLHVAVHNSLGRLKDQLIRVAVEHLNVEVAIGYGHAYVVRGGGSGVENPYYHGRHRCLIEYRTV